MKKNKKKEIIFHPSSNEAKICVPSPKPARNYAPNWYKKTNFFDKNEPNFINGRVDNVTVKGCAPFFDAMSFGYIQETWTDIYIEVSSTGVVTYHYKNDIVKIMSHRSKPTGVKIPENFYDIEFLWIQPWSPVVPDGYSILYTDPINNYSLDTFSTSAVVDSDSFSHLSNGQYPFFIRKGFSGIIPAGTPMYQMIPIKRDSWVSKEINFNEDRANIVKLSLLKRFWGVYKREYRKDKKFL